MQPNFEELVERVETMLKDKVTQAMVDIPQNKINFLRSRFMIEFYDWFGKNIIANPKVSFHPDDESMGELIDREQEAGRI